MIVLLVIAMQMDQHTFLQHPDPIKTEQVQGYLIESRRCAPSVCIQQAALQYGVSPTRLTCLARLESTMNPNAENGRYHGLFQFDYPTWALTPYSTQSIYDPEAASLAAAYLIARGESSRWPPFRNC